MNKFIYDFILDSPSYQNNMVKIHNSTIWFLFFCAHRSNFIRAALNFFCFFFFSFWEFDNFHISLFFCCLTLSFFYFIFYPCLLLFFLIYVVSTRIFLIFLCFFLSFQQVVLLSPSAYYQNAHIICYLFISACFQSIFSILTVFKYLICLCI